MYASKQGNWIKHLDFLLLDLLILCVTYFAADAFRNGVKHLLQSDVYMNVAIVMLLIFVCVAFSLDNYSGILRRSFFMELRAVLFQIILTFAFEVIYIFLMGYGRIFSRAAFLYAAALNVPCVWIARSLLKLYLKRYTSSPKQTMLVLTSSDIADEVLHKLQANSFGDYQIIGVSLIDDDKYDIKEIFGYPVVCKHEEIYDYMQTKWIDAVFANVSRRYTIPNRFFAVCTEMGVTTHLNIAEVSQLSQNLAVENIGGYVVLTKTVKVASFRQMVLKRLMDIVGSFFGLFITILLTIAVGPMIFIASPGPIFFAQKRIGKNGKPFMMYKFRSMVLNAEQLKKDLMTKNKMNGFMFKMDADPRIIGSGSDGTRHGIGWFIRKTSIDEFPQFWNVLKGDMSLVGTRPPTENEWKQYEKRHRARLATKPGITGLWQISGRSNITDFEKVVDLDLQYIENWRLSEDIRILFQTILVVIKGKGSE